jgi:glutathione synthase/RimK-type ligase-like ATP-grasp enzyme
VTHIALATSAEHPDLVEDDQPLRSSLQHRGAEVTAAVWNDPAVDWSAFDAVVIRSTWDYVDHLDAFTAWADRVAAVTRLQNGAAVVRWNAHKGYLDELHAFGLPVVPTRLLRQGDTVALDQVLRRQGWGLAVVKPAVSAGSRDTIRVSLRDAGEHQAFFEALLTKGDVLVQPFVESVSQGGERSLMFFEGRYSHAVRKVAAEGDFRVQPQFGGQISADQPPQKVKDLARSILERAEVDTLYARIDLVRIGEKWKLLELELIEPLLYFSTEPRAAHRFADAILATAAP